MALPEKINPSVLEELWRLQSAILATPDEERLVEGFAQGVRQLPGVREAIVCIDDLSVAATKDGVHRLSPCALPSGVTEFPFEKCPAPTCPIAGRPLSRFALRTRHSEYGVLYIDSSDPTAWAPCEPFVVSLADFVALHIENNRRQKTVAHLTAGLEKQNREQTEVLEGVAKRYRQIFDLSLDGIVILDPDTKSPVEFNEAAHRQLGYTREEFARLTLTDIEAIETPEEIQEHIQQVILGKRSEFETRHRMKSGDIRDVHVTAQYLNVAGHPIYHCIWRDITQIKRAEGEREVTLCLLGLLNRANDTHELLAGVTLLMRDWSGCEAVGVRLEEGEDYPYFETRGFPSEFIKTENRLCRMDETGAIVRDNQHNPVLECMCGNVIRGRFDPDLPFFTSSGSFWTNNTTELLAASTEADRQARTRNRCHGEGYESVALIPIRSQNKTFGILQFNDRRRDRFTEESIRLLERLAASLAIGLAERIAEENLRKREARYQKYIASISDVIAVLDTDCKILYKSPNITRQFGWLPEDLIGTDGWLTVHPDDLETVQQTFLDIIREPDHEPKTIQYRYRCKDQTYTSIELWAVNMVDDPDVKGVLANYRDISKRIMAEDALRKSEEKFRLAFYTSPDSININRMSDGLYLEVNEGFLRIIGYERDDVLGRTSRELEIWHDPKDRERLVDGLHKTGFVENLPADFRRCDGTIRHGLMSARVMDLNGEKCILSVTRDVTPLKEAEESVRRSEARFRQMADLLPQAIWEADLEGRFTYVNEAGYRTFGYAPEDFDQGVFVWDLLDPSIIEKARINFGKTPDDPNRVGGSEYICVKKGGQRFPAMIFSAPIMEGDRPVGVRGITLDMSERKAAEAERDRLMMAIDQAAETILITDIDGNIEYVNPAFEQITGYRREEVIGQHTRILKSGAHDAIFYQEMWAVLNRGESWRGRMQNKKKNGSLFTEEAVISPVRDETGLIVNFVAVKRDITNELGLEEQLRQAQKMEAVGQLAGGVAHDFNNLLQVILGYGEIAQDQLKGEPSVHEAIEEMLKAGNRAKTLVSQLLAFSRRQVLDMKDVNLNEAIGDMLKMLHRVIGEHINLNFSPGRALGTVQADPGQIGQILTNLCVNARDAMPSGGVITITTTNARIEAPFCETHAWARPGCFVLLSVTDTGCGIDAETLDRIFEPFFTTKAVGEGTGLGLSTVYGLVKQHEGFLNVDSAVGQGTTFNIYLPTVEHPATACGDKTKKPVTGGAETILLAEDEEMVRQLTQTILERAGYTVLTACDGEEALKVFEAHADEIDLLLLDVIMPKLGGRVVYDRIREQHPGVRALFASGYSMSSVHNDFVLEEGLRLIQKPARRDALLSEVRKALDE